MLFFYRYKRSRKKMVSQLFHFTKLYRLKNILSRDSLNVGFINIGPDVGFNNFIYFTRDKNHCYITEVFGANCVLVFDREKLCYNYSLKLSAGWFQNFKSFGGKPVEGKKVYDWYQKVHGVTHSPQEVQKIIVNHGRESEERISRSVTNLKKYLLEIVVTKKEIVEKILPYGKTNNISISIADFTYNRVWYPNRTKIYLRE